MLRVENLKKAFLSPDSPARETAGAVRPANPPATVPVVDVEHLELSAGEQVALLGSSGSGKTTLLHLLAGILAPDTGKVEYTLGKQVTDIVHLPEAARDHFRGQHIGYIFQTHHLLPGLTALENVLLGMSFTGRHADHSFATHLLDRVGLAHRLGYKPGKLSVGQQQRVAVARALANRPALVLADEPTGALDAVSAQQTLDLIRSLCTEISAALLLVTHDLAIAGQMGRQLQLASINRAAVQMPIRPNGHPRAQSEGAP
jgi:ABC-type lipoprotein export system ATPase subunit